MLRTKNPLKSPKFRPIKYSKHNTVENNNTENTNKKLYSSLKIILQVNMIHSPRKKAHSDEILEKYWPTECSSE